MKVKRLIIVYGVLLMVALATMFELSRYRHQKEVSHPRDYEEIMSDGVLRMETEYNQSGYYLSGDTFMGFQYELSKAIAEISGLEVQTRLEMSLSKSLENLSNRECDIIARNIPITSEMREKYLFTDPIVLNKQVLIQQKADANSGMEPIRNQLDLAGRRLHVPKDSPVILRLQNLSHEIGDTIYIIENDMYSAEQLMIMVAKGEIDYAVCDQQIARATAKKLPELDITTDISFTQLQSWAVRKESPILLDSINSWLRKIRDNGIYDRIYKRYYQ